jgi:hypothetical protein
VLDQPGCYPFNVRALPKNPALQVILWGAYLACSWTWCIGMFLPVLLVRDFGHASFFVFAVPNVLGAMLMGLALARPGASEQFVERHRAACAWFSAVTLAFQVFFLVWLLKGVFMPASARWVFAGVLPLVLIIRSHRSQWSAGVALVLLAVSAAAGLAWWRHSPHTPQGLTPLLPQSDLAWLAPVCLFGFGLCPYLDLTFHAARQKVAGAPGSIAFVLGFGVMFLTMILLTLAYATPLIQRSLDAGYPVQPGLLAAPLLLHVAAQLAYTGRLHADALEKALPGNWDAARPFWATLAGVGLGAISGPLVDPENIYRSFMGFYGLIFPAYVWICVIHRPALTRHALHVWAGAVLAALPMFWMGFIERRTWWLAPGIVLVLAARLLVPARDKPGNPASEPQRAA